MICNEIWNERYCRFVSLDEGHVTGLKSQEDEDIHYASVTVAGSSQGEAHGSSH